MEQGTTSAGDLSSLLGNLLSDPGQMAKLTQLAGALASSGGLGALIGGAVPTQRREVAEEAPLPKEESAQENTSAQEPEIVAQPRTQEQTADSLMAALAKLRGGMGKVHTTKHEALLRALRPYLSNERQTRIDGLLRLLTLVSVLGSVLETTQGTGGTPSSLP